MRACGVAESQVFGTDDLYEENNMVEFIRSVAHFGGVIQTKPEGAALPKLGPAVGHSMGDKDQKRASGVVGQYEAMERNMEVERPKNTGITAGADAGK